MGSEYPDWHPLSTVSAHRDECECRRGRYPIAIETIEGTAAYICQECEGYVP